jgi:hypothetical protein
LFKQRFSTAHCRGQEIRTFVVWGSSPIRTRQQLRSGRWDRLGHRLGWVLWLGSHLFACFCNLISVKQPKCSHLWSEMVSLSPNLMELSIIMIILMAHLFDPIFKVSDQLTLDDLYKLNSKLFKKLRIREADMTLLMHKALVRKLWSLLVRVKINIMIIIRLIISIWHQKTFSWSI